ncbi:unnamed protein product [Arabidopsis halleri]
MVGGRERDSNSSKHKIHCIEEAIQKPNHPWKCLVSKSGSSPMNYQTRYRSSGLLKLQQPVLLMLGPGPSNLTPWNLAPLSRFALSKKSEQ